jgi:dienelactone hydrolase
MSTGSSVITTVESFTSQSKTIAVEVLKRAGSAAAPAIVIAHGADGLTAPWDGQIRDFATFLATNGFVALIPHYFDSTGGAPVANLDPVTLGKNRDAWTKTIDDALRHAGGRPDVTAGQLGSLGFSLGGHLVLRQAMLGAGSQAVLCVVEFFAPIAGPGFSVQDGLTTGIAALPPVQIHHGEDDGLVPIDQSRGLVRALEGAGKKAGTDYEFYSYVKERHGFTAAADIKASMDRSLSFFLTHIK